MLNFFCHNLSGSSRSQIYYFTDYVCGTQTQLSEWILSCVVLKIGFSQFSTFARENMLLEKSSGRSKLRKMVYDSSSFAIRKNLLKFQLVASTQLKVKRCGTPSLSRKKDLIIG